MHQYRELDDTVYFWFGSNDTSGSGDDGASPICDVRLAGAAAGAAPVYEPTPILLTHASYMPGAHEVAIAATVANGFADGETYGTFCSLAVDGQNPTGFVGSFELAPIIATIARSITAVEWAYIVQSPAGTFIEGAQSGSLRILQAQILFGQA